jgi:primary-amine oxidase
MNWLGVAAVLFIPTQSLAQIGSLPRSDWMLRGFEAVSNSSADVLRAGGATASAIQRPAAARTRADVQPQPPFPGVSAYVTSVSPAQAQQPPHPLDPLTGEELDAAAQLLLHSGRMSDASRFHYLGLLEPPKQTVLNWQLGSAVPRQAFAVIYNYATNKTAEAVVDLNAHSLASWKEVPGVQPALTWEDFELGDKIIRADPRWQEAIRKRGITDLENVDVGNVTFAYETDKERSGHRLQFSTPFYRGKGRNGWARPIEGIKAWADLNEKKVYRFVDTGVVPLAPAEEIDEASLGAPREAPKPLEITQSHGPTFEVRGWEVRWQKWRFRYGQNAREGLVLYQVGYEDGGRLRSVLYRASVSEMVVPYGDPDPAWYVRSYFDAGEYSAGRRAVSLEPLRDVPPNATLLNAAFIAPSGKVEALPRSASLYERDGGLLWRHYDEDSKTTEARRSRELVLSSMLTIANYDYGFNWVFHQDGSLEMEILMTGIMMVKGIKDGGGHDDHGHAVGANLRAVHHQHLINFRLDFDVDGTANSVAELNTLAAPSGPQNPVGTSFVMHETVLATEQIAHRNLNLASNRRWKVFNPSVKNDLDQQVGYLLLPGENSAGHALPGSLLRRRAGFLGSHLWVTPYAAEEKYAAGDYPVQSTSESGLAAWARANRPLVNRDIVLWYTVGVTHIPRPEEWPVMTVHKAGFQLVPAGFFSRNPALDVPK